MVMEYVIRLHWERWLSEERGRRMFEQVPFGMDILVGIMFEAWPILAESTFATGHELVCDFIDAYSFEDDLEVPGVPFNPTAVYMSVIEPYYDLMVEIVYDLFHQSFAQLYPVFNDACNVGQWIPSFGGMGPHHAILRMCDSGEQPATIPISSIVTPNTVHL